MSVPFGQAIVPPSGFDRDAREVGGITQRFECSAPLAPGEIDIANSSVRERQEQPVLVDDLDRRDAHKLVQEQNPMGAGRSVANPRNPAERLGHRA